MKKITKEDAETRLNNHNPNIILIGEYVNIITKTYFKCINCNTIKYCSLFDVLDSTRKIGCVNCEKRSKNKKENSRTKSHENYVLEINNIWGNLIEIIGQYNGSSKKIETKCNVCNTIWNPEAKSLLKKHGCPKCGHEKNKNSTVKSHENYINEVMIKHNGNLIVTGNYISCKHKLLIKCNKCQHEWLSFPRNILKGRGCPKCRLNKGETLINSILDEMNINFIAQYIIKDLRTTINGIPRFDFAIFDSDNQLTTIIEYDGLQHFKPVDYWGGESRLIDQQNVDDFKNQYCKDNNIKMIRIKYGEFKNINIGYIRNCLNK